MNQEEAVEIDRLNSLKDVTDLIEELRVRQRKDSVPLSKFKREVASVIEDLSIMELRTYQENQELRKRLLEQQQQYSRLKHSYEQACKLITPR